ncbi:phage holin family protein [soil metagenome]
MKLLLRWLAAALAVAAATYLVEGIRLAASPAAYLGISLILGLVNALVRPILRRLACGIIFITLGLFLLVINAAMLMLAAWIARGAGIAFYVDSLWAALLGSVIISLVSFLAALVLHRTSGQKKKR